MVLPDGKGSIILFDWMSAGVSGGRNLVRLSEDGQLVWAAAAPFKANDCFVSLAWDQAGPVVNTWSGYRATVNLENGALEALEFVK